MSALTARPRRSWIAWVRGWPLWELPPWLAAYVSGVIIVYLAATCAAASQTVFRPHDVLLFGVLLAFGAASIEFTKRSGEPAGLIRDVYGVWHLPIAIFLPPVYALAAPVAKLTFTQWRTRQTMAYRRIFTIASVGLAYGAASWVFHAVVARAAEITPGPGARWLIWAGLAGACALLRWAVNAALVLIAVRGTDRTVNVRQVQFSREPIYNDLAELCISLAAAALVACNPLLILLFLPAITLLQRSLRHAQLSAASRTDAKTGLLNATTFQQEAVVEVARAGRTRAPVAFAMIDIDHFKYVNDTYGHLVGDSVLALLAATMRAILRDYDIVGRFGGEEFCVLLPGTNAAEAEQIAERLRRKLAQIVVPAGPGSEPISVQVTVSIGVATLDSSRSDLDDLIAAADAALYRAKAAGRNRVCVIDDQKGDS
jgi:diguanylate cyclase (GGDEF)-like protein